MTQISRIRCKIYDVGPNGGQIGNQQWAFVWHHYRWPWMTFNRPSSRSLQLQSNISIMGRYTFHRMYFLSSHLSICSANTVQTVNIGRGPYIINRTCSLSSRYASLEHRRMPAQDSWVIMCWNQAAAGLTLRLSPFSKRRNPFALLQETERITAFAGEQSRNLVIWRYIVSDGLSIWFTNSVQAKHASLAVHTVLTSDPSTDVRECVLHPRNKTAKRHMTTPYRQNLGSLSHVCQPCH